MRGDARGRCSSPVARRTGRAAQGRAAGGNEAETFRGATNKALEMIETAINSGGHVSGKTTGFTSINEKCGGLHNSDLIIVAGRPGMGKTSLATNIAFNCADRMLRERRRLRSDSAGMASAVAGVASDIGHTDPGVGGPAMCNGERQDRARHDRAEYPF